MHCLLPYSPAFDRESGMPGRRQRAVTLVEVMIALGLLALTSVSVISVTFQIRSMAEQTVYQNTALTLAQGYMEQIRHIDYTTLRSVAVETGTATVNLPLDRTDMTAVTNASGGVFGNRSWSAETVYMDQTSSGRPIQPLNFEFQPVLVNLESASGLTAGLATGVEITLNYRVTYNYGVRRTVTGALRSVRSAVPSY